MPSSDYHLNFTWKELFAGAERLTAKDFEKLIEALINLKSRKNSPFLPERESDLLKKINAGFPEQVQKRINVLREISQQRLHTEEEEKEFSSLIEQLENYGAERIGWLAELAQIRQVSVRQLMKELEIEPSFDG